MLFSYDYIHSHPARKLNQHVIYFFRKLKGVDNTSVFNPYTNYFHADFVTHLNRAYELRDRFELFFNAFKVLTLTERTSVVLTFISAQNIKGIIESIGVNGNQFNVNGLPLSLRKPVKDLFSFMYPSTLNRGNALTNHYQEVYNDVYTNRKLKVCPFCGIEQLFPPHIRRQDYDHILKQENYPFTTVNMKNLVPMGRDCNEIFKNRQDAIYNPKTGTRRVFGYPFERSYNIQLNLTTSLLPGTGSHKTGKWIINFNPFDDFVETWEEVFDIRVRYRDMILSRYFDDWMVQFEESIKNSKTKITSRKALKSEFRFKANIYLSQPFLEFGIVKGALFKLLATCNDNYFYDTIIYNLNN